MGRAALLTALGTAAITGCAAFSMERGPDPRDRLHEGVMALEAQDYARAQRLLEPVYLEHWREPVGRRAMLALIAAELDSRNPDRRLWAAADLAARLLNVPEIESWLIPIAESYYLLAVELGANEERLARADSARVAAEARAARAEANRRLPASARESVPARLSRVESQRATLESRLEEAEQQLAARTAELREARQELERIKKTIKP